MGWLNWHWQGKPEAMQLDKSQIETKTAPHAKQGRDSRMVSADQPKPEYKPPMPRGMQRTDFNNRWLQEQRNAALDHMQQQRQQAANDMRREFNQQNLRDLPTFEQGA